uniref:26S proteasome complex subunit SEM1 n=1 Tax=Oncorhynchus tshawytscha TaxID=74940 RepID=A0A8C8F610_ONCTS
MSDKKQTVDLGLLEEDDEFEEFPAEDWTGLDEDEDAHVWEDNWDDDNVEDDFSNQLRAVLGVSQYGHCNLLPWPHLQSSCLLAACLRAELEKHGSKMETS